MTQRRLPPSNGGWLARWFGPVFFGREAHRPSTGVSVQEAGFGRELLYRLRENEQVWSGFRELELELLSAGTLRDVFRAITPSLPERFPSISDVTIAWLDPDYELTRLLNVIDPEMVHRVIGLRGRDNETCIPRERPWLGRPDTDMQQLLFPRPMHSVSSVAIVPLRLRGEWIGSLNQASTVSGHYSAEMATDLLEHLAQVFALCVDNALNRIRLQRDGLTDPLTGVANRRFFARRLQEEISQWLRHGGHVSCLLVDIDHFKDINDRYGHPVGDQVLQGVARALSTKLRSSDVLARHGGEEFVLLLPGAEPERATEIAERLRQDVAKQIVNVPGSGQVSVTVSIGVAALKPDQRGSLEDPGLWLVRETDEHLYRAKAQGRNRVVTT